MSEIPDDIRVRAQRACDVIPADCDPDYESITVDIISRAILGERERCAQVAEGMGRAASRDRATFILAGFAGLSRVIAAAIRADTTQERTP